MEAQKMGEAIAIITARIPDGFVYRVAARRDDDADHWVLLVVTKEQTLHKASDLACEVGQKVAGLRLCLLLHTSAQLSPKAHDRRSFFASVVNSGRCLHAGPFAEPYVSVTTATADPHAPAVFAFDRLALAESLMQSARKRGGAHNIIGLAELQQVVCLSALAVLRLKTGYVPVHFNTDFLLGLCEYVMPCRHVFLRDGPVRGKKVLKCLATGTGTLRHATQLEVPPGQYADVLRTVFEFNTLAVNFVSKQLSNVKPQFPDYEYAPFN